MSRAAVCGLGHTRTRCSRRQSRRDGWGILNVVSMSYDPHPQPPQRPSKLLVGGIVWGLVVLMFVIGIVFKFH